MREVQGLPELIVTLGGQRLAAAEVASVGSVRVRYALGQPAQCLLTIDAGESQARRLDATPGEALQVELGGVREPLFVGEVAVVEFAHGSDASFEVRLRAYDALHRLRMRQHTQQYDDVDLSALAGALAAGSGLTVEGSPIRLGRVYQCARSDLDTLVRTSARVGRYPVVDGTVLRLVDLAGEGEPIELELGSSLHAAELEVSHEPAFRTAETVQWDPDSAASSTSAADRSMARASVSADPAPANVGGGGTIRRADEVVSEALGDALAQAELDVRSTAEVSAVLVADGNPHLKAGRRVRLAAVAARFEGVYTICEAVHLIDGSGYETTVSTRPPPSPPGRLADRVTLGIIDRVDDPEGRGRAQARLPAYPDLVTDWAPVLVAAAGPGKGVVALPAPGDSVLVLLTAGDPGQAIVLGGLYGSEQTPDADEDGERAERLSIVGAGGQRITLDGPARRTSVHDGHGSLLELGPDLVRLSAATDLLIEAPGRAMTVRARTVDFEEAP